MRAGTIRNRLTAATRISQLSQLTAPRPFASQNQNLRTRFALNAYLASTLLGAPGDTEEMIMQRNLWTLAFVAVLATGLTHAQRVDNNVQNRTTPRVGAQERPTPAVQPSPDSTGAAGQASTPKIAKMDSADLQMRIQQAFQRDAGLAIANLGAYVSTDKVSLAGTVKSKADKDRAQNIAEAMADGRSVVNYIRVNSSPNYGTRTDGSTWPSSTTTAATDKSPYDTSTQDSGSATSPAGSTKSPRTPPRR
jgi:osmotically-inducible protein OsmY